MYGVGCNYKLPFCRNHCKIANEMYTELGDVKTSVTEFAKSQGFVSAGEKASYQRTFEKAQQVLTRRE